MIEVYKRKTLFTPEHPIQKRLTEIERDYIQRERKAEEEIRRAAAVAELILSDQAVEALNKLAQGWAEARSSENFDDYQESLLESTKRARELLIEAAKRELQLRVSR